MQRAAWLAETGIPDEIAAGMRPPVEWQFVVAKPGHAVQ